MIAALTLLCAALAAAPAPAVPEVKKANFILPNLVLVRKPQFAPTAVIRSPVKVSLSSSARERFHMPVLRLTCLCEIDGMFVCMTGFWCRQNTYDRMSSSEISDALKLSGRKFTGEDLKRARMDPAVFTPFLPETSRTANMMSVYGNPMDKTHGFFRLNRIGGTARLLVYHCELWQNGALVGEHESSHTGLGKYAIPADWHVWKRYPTKFKYVESY